MEDENPRIAGEVFSADQLLLESGAIAIADQDIAAIQAAIAEANAEPNGLSQLLAALVLLLLISSAPSNRLTYRQSEGLYYRGQRAVSIAEIEQIIGRDRANTTERYRRQVQELIDGNITLADWQRFMASDLYHSHLRMTQAGAGTAAGLNAEHLRRLGDRLSAEFTALSGFAAAIAIGSVSAIAMIARASRYATNTGASYYDAEHALRVSQGGWQGRRSLDPGADHCPECPGYVTDGFVAAAEVVPKGDRCSCRGNCRCLVIWRRSLSDAVLG